MRERERERERERGGDPDFWKYPRKLQSTLLSRYHILSAHEESQDILYPESLVPLLPMATRLRKVDARPHEGAFAAENMGSNEFFVFFTWQ